MENLEQKLSENLSITSRHETDSSNSVREEYSDPIIVDLLIDIFSRVTGKSIARFRCVSKSWESILGRPDFTELFLTKSSTRPRLFFALEANGKLFFYSSPQPQNPDDNSSLVATPYHKSYPKYFPYHHYHCTTVCGLVLLQGWRRKARVICNPATREFLTLPKVFLKTKNLPKVKGNNPDREAKAWIGGMYLGYDPISKQYKVLCMTSSRDERPNTHQVLTLESGKRLWRTIEFKFHFRGCGEIIGNICINGVLYFGDGSVQSSVVVCFDVRSEKFSFVNTDKDMDVEESPLTLFNHKGKLGAHQDNTFMGNDNEFVLWVLEDAGDHKWSKHAYVLPSLVHTFDHNFINNYKFVGMTGTGEIVWSSYYLRNSFHVVFYNLERNISTSVNIQGFEEFNHRHRLAATVKTFIGYVENMKFI